MTNVETYAQEREQFGVPIGSFQRVQDVIIDMDITLEQGLTWLIDLTNRYDDNTLDRESAAKVKIECSQSLRSHDNGHGNMWWSFFFRRVWFD